MVRINENIPFPNTTVDSLKAPGLNVHKAKQIFIDYPNFIKNECRESKLLAKTNFIQASVVAGLIAVGIAVPTFLVLGGLALAGVVPFIATIACITPLVAAVPLVIYLIGPSIKNMLDWGNVLDSAKKVEEQFLWRYNGGALLENQEVEKLWGEIEIDSSDNYITTYKLRPKLHEINSKLMAQMNFEQLSIIKHIIGKDKFKFLIEMEKMNSTDAMNNWLLILNAPRGYYDKFIKYLDSDIIKDKIEKSPMFARELRLHLKDYKGDKSIERRIYPSVFEKLNEPGYQISINFDDGYSIKIDENLLKKRSGFFQEAFDEFGFFGLFENVPASKLPNAKLYFQALTDPNFRLTKENALKLVPVCAFYRDDALLSFIDTFIADHSRKNEQESLFNNQEIKFLIKHHKDNLPKLAKLFK